MCFLLHLAYVMHIAIKLPFFLYSSLRCSLWGVPHMLYSHISLTWWDNWVPFAYFTCELLNNAKPLTWRESVRLLSLRYFRNLTFLFFLFLCGSFEELKFLHPLVVWYIPRKLCWVLRCPFIPSSVERVMKWKDFSIPAQLLLIAAEFQVFPGKF